MAKIRSLEENEGFVYPELSGAERACLAKKVVPISEAKKLSVVPVELRATEEAARWADEMCLRELEANFRARRASWL
ncbi:MAG: hypothetical protein Q4F60_01065 [Candidatus Saccharibacteria bacterium]|nr:hypothetical protein [Candidatus Saccharibacteria bacterium]